MQATLKRKDVPTASSGHARSGHPQLNKRNSKPHAHHFPATELPYCFSHDSRWTSEYKETSILSRVKQITSPGWMHWNKYSGLVHWEDPEGWDGEGSGRGDWDVIHVNPWLIHVNVWQKPLQYCKVISLQLIKRNEKKKELLIVNNIKRFLFPFFYFLSPPTLFASPTIVWESSNITK